MDTGNRTILKNAGALMVSQMITWVMSFLLTMVQSRYLGPQGMGKVYLGNSIWYIFGMFISFGMNMVMIKEIARDPEQTGELVGTSLILRGLLYIPVTSSLALYLWLAQYPLETIFVILIIGVSIFLLEMGNVFDSALQGLERMEFTSLATTIGKVVHAIVVSAACFLGASIYVVMAVCAIGPSIIMLSQFIALIRLKKIVVRIRWPQMVWMLKAGIPYLLSNLFLVVYSNIDAVIISLQVNEKTVGWYGAADGFYATLMFLPTILTQALFPALARKYSQGDSDFSSMLSKSLDWIMIIGMPIGVGIAIISKSVMVLIYGSEYEPSSPVLSILGFVLIFMYINILLGRFLIATDRQNTWTIVMAVATVATLPLDLLIIPWCSRVLGNGAIGGAITYLITESAMMVTGLQLLPKGTLNKVDIWHIIKIIGASFVMGASVWWLRNEFIILPILVGVIVYCLLILTLRIVSREDLVMIYGLGKSIFSRVLARLFGRTSLDNPPL